MSNYEIESLKEKIKLQEEYIKELIEHSKKLKDEIENLKSNTENEQKNGRWKPKEDEIYYFIQDTSEIKSTNWVSDEIDKWRYINNNVFQTIKEAQKYREFYEDVLEHSYEFSDEEWRDCDIDKYFIYFVARENSFDISCDYADMDFNKIYFKTEEDAQYIIDKYPEELKKWRI